VEGLTDYLGQIQPRMQTQDYGDVVLIVASIPKDQYSYFFTPLDDLGLEGELYFEDLWEVDGKPYGYSMGVSVEGLVYNKNVFKKLGLKAPFKTLDELHAAAKKIKAAGIVPLAINMGAGWPMAQWDKLAAFYYGDFSYYDAMLEDPAPYNPEKPHGKALQFVKTFFDNGWTEEDYVSNNWEESKGHIARGDYAMWFFGNWSIPQIGTLNDNWREEIGFMPLPIDNTSQPKALLANDYAYAVSAFSKNPTTAKAWVRFLLVETDYPEVAGYMPTSKNQTSTIPQLAEIMSYNPDVITVKATSTNFTKAGNKARIDFFSGGYIRDLLLEENFERAIEKLNRRWAKAIKRLQ
jgi:ABC-type glycerol-3-phosphate transport system substrate-binding protein